MEKSKLAKRSGLALALEPRMMFDAAAATTADTVTSDTNTAPEAAQSEVEATDGTTGHDYSYTLSDSLFTDADGDTLTWTVSDLPDGLSFDADTHTISGTPTTAGDYTITVTATDSDGESASLTLSLDVDENAAPEVADTDYTLTDAEEGTSYSTTLSDSLFSDADGDTLTWTVSDLPDGLSFDADTLTLSGTPTTAGTYTITVTVTDEAGESVSTELTLTVTDPDAPSVDADTSGGTCVVDSDGNITAGSSLDLFDNVDIDLGDDSETLENLVITVGTAGSEHSLVIDGTTITLTATTQAQETATHGYSYEVAVVDGNAVITIYLSNGTDYSASTVATVIDSITYEVADTSELASDSFTVSLTSLSDESDTADLDISATVTIDSSVNLPPTATSDNDLTLGESISGTDLDETLEVIYSSDGNYVYALDSDGTLCVFSVDDNGSLTEIQSLDDVTDLDSATAMVLNSENSTLYVLNGDTLVALTVGSDGTLTYAASLDVYYTYTFSSGTTKTYTTDGATLSISDDGEQIYVGTSTNGLIVYNVDLEDSDSDGSTYDLTFVQRITKSYANKYATVTAVGDYVFVVSAYNPIALTVYQRSDDGTLSKVDSLNTDTTGITYTDFGLTTSEDGSMVFLSITATNEIIVYSTDTDTGELTKLSTLTTDSTVMDIQSSDDGSTLYVLTSDGTLSIYSVDDNGELTLTDTVEDLDNANALSLSDDGEILVAGDYIYRISSKLMGSFDETFDFAADITIADANLDLLNDGEGNYGGATVTVQRADGADSADTFSFTETDTYTVSGNSILKDGEVVATFTNENGTLVISFADGTTTAEANAILHQWTYSNDGSNSDDSEITLTVVVNDGELDSAALEVTILFTSGNSAPSLTTTVEGSDEFDTAGEEVSLFDGTSVSTGDANQTLTELVISVSGLSDVSDAEYIVVDGTTIALSASSEGTTANGYTYTYTLSDDGTATLTISCSDGISAATMADLVDGMAYGNTSESAMTGTRTFTLTSLKDSGGTAGDGVDTVSLDITSTVVVAVNNSPTITINSDGDSGIYYNDGSLDGFSDYVSEVDMSDDGTTVIVLGSSESGGDGDSTLYVYSRDTETGELTLLQTFTSDEASGIQYLGSAVISSDGQWVYVSSYDGDTTESVLLFSRDTDTGELTYVGEVASVTVTKSGSSWSTNTLAAELVLYEDEDIGVSSLYLVCGTNQNYASAKNSTITSYTVGDDGTLTEVSSYTGGSTESGVYLPSDLVISDDGAYAYVANYSGSCIGIFSRDTETGALTFVASITVDDLEADGSEVNSKALSYLRDITLSADGNYLYLSSFYGLVTVLQVDGDSVTYVDSISVGSRLTSVTLSEDGSTLYVGSRTSSMYVCTLDTSTGEITNVDTISTGIYASNLVVSPDGDDIYLGSYWNKQSGLQTVSTLPMAELNHDGSAAVIGDSISFSDADVTDYNGFTITLERVDGGSDSDSYGFNDTDDLTLSDGVIYYDGTAIATFTESDGTLTLTFTDSVTETVANLVVSQITYSGTSTAVLTVTVSDGSKSSSTNLALVYPNETPTTSSEGGALDDATTGHDYEYTLPDLSELFSDADGDTLTYEVSDLPDGLSYDSTTNTISGMPTTAGDYTITVTATDPSGASVSIEYTLSVAENSAPVATSDSLTDARTDYDYSYDLSSLFTDADGDEITITVEDLPDGLTYDADTMTISGQATTVGDYTVTITATDGITETTVTLTLSVAENISPTYAGEDFTLDQVTYGTAYEMVLPEDLFTDANGDTLTYTVSGLPDGLTFDADTMTISGTTTAEDTTVTITVSDGYGGTASYTTTLEVATPPSLSADVTNGSCSIAADGTVTDNDVDLFENVTVAQDAYSEELTTLVLTVDTYGENHALVIDGQEIVLTATSGTSETTTNGYSYTVEIVDGQAVVTIDLTSSSASSAADVQTLIDSITYRVADSYMESSSVTVTLTSLNDAGEDSAAVNISSTVNIDSDIVFTTDSLPSSGQTDEQSQTPNVEDSGHDTEDDSSWNKNVLDSSEQQSSSSSTTSSTLSDADSVLSVLSSLLSESASDSTTEYDLSDTTSSVLDLEISLDGDSTLLEEIHGTWTYDVAGNSNVFALPSPDQLGINAAITSFKLVWADTGKPTEGLRLDMTRWSLVSVGFKSPGHAKVLVRIETQNGELIEIPVEVDDLSQPTGREAKSTAPTVGKENQITGALTIPAPSTWNADAPISATMLGEDSHETPFNGKPALAMQLNQSLRHSTDAGMSPSTSDTAEVPSGKEAARSAMVAVG